VDVMSDSAREERGRLRRYAIASVIMLVCSAMLRITAPSPWAPRVNVRWIDGLADADRSSLERMFGLLNGVHDEGSTWTYDLTLVSAESVKALVAERAVADTHFIDRRGDTIDSDAARGVTPLELQGLARIRNSPLFLWFVLFWLSSLLVSGAWLYAGREASLD
jgi:hypothetical protein